MSYVRGIRAVVLGVSMGVAGTTVFTGCDALDKYVPKSAQNQLMELVRLNISFSVSGAPSDQIDKTFFYADRIAGLTTTARQQGDAMVMEFARTFDFKVQALTEENMEKLTGEISSIDPSEVTPEQKQWLERNIPAIKGWAISGVKLIDAGKNVGLALPAAGAKVKEDFKSASPAMKDRYGRYIEQFPGLLEDVDTVVSDGVPALINIGNVVEAMIVLSSATGVEPPTKEESDQEAMKLMSKGLPEGEEVDGFSDA